MESQLVTKRVLGIVEDERDMQLLLRLTLGADPRLDLGGEATSAEEALELAQSWEPDLIVLDQSLDGELTGLEAAPLLKALVPETKILLFTAYDLRARAEAEPAVDDFLRKDNFAALLPTVNRMLGLEPLT